MQTLITGGIPNMDRSPPEDRVLNIAKGISSATGESFFRSLVEHLAASLDAHRVFIGELVEAGSERVRTIAVWADGKIVDNFEYDLAHTPCRHVIGKSLCSYASGVQQSFPQDRFLAEMKVEGYVGTPLLDSGGRALGLIVVLFDHPIESPKLAESILQIFAVRAGAELERRRAEMALRHSEERWRQVFENSAIGIALSNVDGRFLAANAAFQRMLGYTGEELLALSWPDITHEEDRGNNLALYQEFLSGKLQQFKIEKRYRRKDGRVLWVSNTISRVLDGGYCPGFVMALVEDVTERKRLQQQLQEEHERLRLLLNLTNEVLSHLDLRQLCQAVSSSVRRVMQCDFVGLTLPDLEAGGMRLYTLDFPDGKGTVRAGALFPMEGTPSGLTFRTGRLQVFDAQRMAQFDRGINPGLAEGLKSGCFFPLIHCDRLLGTLNLLRLADSVFSDGEIDFLEKIAGQVAIAVDNALNYREVSEAKERLAEEKRCLEDEIRIEHDFGEIIGESPALACALKQVEIVATTDATVLISGETGTGKELIARAIHDLSARSAHPFVKVNCAAIPRDLLESELFGHEKGAFTGAIARRIGRFELAHEGTLFLDEIGEIPLDLQPKLLRVLQEQEFERLGSARTVKTNVRLVVATNRNLARMVKEQTFRDDLYYRLNVFPITVPPLRERPQDIAPLVRHFVEKFARRINRPITHIPNEVIEALKRYQWPGNVRELQNVIERAVILSPNGVLRVPLPDSVSVHKESSTMRGASRTLEDVEREHILQVLRETDWVIGGPKGAAERLGLKRSTLRSRMEKLGISRDMS
ncbi:sigma 54-interacting transcriptional regulator [Methylocaldum gracile subsp. desertum]|uniref:sigma 54-interacting transcriptional regulator n=1 Tax=Methylocaldum sp. GT1BW TaxID=3438964 RepID=UPI003D9FCED8